MYIFKPYELVTKSHGGSGYGISFWSTFRSGCPQRVMLNKLHNAQEQDISDLVSINPNIDTKVNAAHRGTYVHKLLELYYVNKLDPLNPDQVTFEFNGAMEVDASWQDALRIFRAYRQRFPQNEWETVAAERRVRFGCPRPLGDECKEDHDHEQAWEFAFVHFGVPVISVQFDLEARFGEEQREPLITNRMIPLFDPGKIIVDHKVKNARYSNRESELLHRLQFTLYQMANDLLFPDEPCQGLLANCIYPYKREVEFESFMIPRVTTERATVLNNYLSRAWSEFLRYKWAPNEDACQGYGRTCFWLTSNVCRQLPINFDEPETP